MIGWFRGRGGVVQTFLIESHVSQEPVWSGYGGARAPMPPVAAPLVKGSHVLGPTSLDEIQHLHA